MLTLEAKDPVVVGDEVQLRQVFVNLVLNALQAVGEEGQVEVRTWLEESHLVIDVKDDGPGIPPSRRHGLQALLHDQAARQRDRARPVHRAPHHRDPGRRTRARGRPRRATRPSASGCCEAIHDAGSHALKLTDQLRVLVVDDEEDIRLGLDAPGGFGGGAGEGGGERHWPRSRCSSAGGRRPRPDRPDDAQDVGSELLVEVKKRSPETEVVILTGYGTVQSAVQCLQSGAAHFLTKPFDNDGVVQLVERLGRQVLARRTARGGGRDAALLAQDARMKPVTELIARVAASPVSVLIEGESGTGKELVARADPPPERRRRQKPFLAVNAAALPDTLLESELFGHRTRRLHRRRPGARRDLRRGEGRHRVPGRGGVDVALVPGQAPARPAGEGRAPARRLRGPRGRLRLLAATNRDLEAKIKEGEFREDLFYRLGVVRIFVPPLRERPDDIPLLLANHFLQRSASTSLGQGVPRCRGSPTRR